MGMEELKIERSRVEVKYVFAKKNDRASSAEGADERFSAAPDARSRSARKSDADVAPSVFTAVEFSRSSPIAPSACQGSPADAVP